MAVAQSSTGLSGLSPGEAERAAKEVLEEVLDGLREGADDRWVANPLDPVAKALMKHVERASDARHLRAMIYMAKSEPGMTSKLIEFDSDPMLLGVANGVLDLNSGTLLPVAPDVLVSKRCSVAYDPGAECPRFEQFMIEIQPDPGVRTFLQIFLGYCLTGYVSAQIFAFLHGLGANGKSVLVEIIAWVLGDYAHKIATEMLMHHQRNPQGPSRPSRSKLGVEPVEFDAGVGGCELPIGFGVMLVSMGLPGCDLAFEG